MANIYVQAFKELIDETIRENKNNPEGAKQLILNEVLREAKKGVQTRKYQEVQRRAEARLAEIGADLKGMK